MEVSWRDLKVGDTFEVFTKTGKHATFDDMPGARLGDKNHRYKLRHKRKENRDLRVAYEVSNRWVAYEVSNRWIEMGFISATDNCYLEKLDKLIFVLI